MSLRRKRPAFPRALGSALRLLLAVLLALGAVRPVWAAVHQFTGEEPGDNAARASMALVQGPKAAADQKKEDAKAAKENGWCCACHQG